MIAPLREIIKLSKSTFGGVRKVNKKVKFGLILLFILVILGVLVANRSQRISGPSEKQLKVVVSIPLLKTMVERIGGDEVYAVSIIQGAVCSHEYEPTTMDMKRIAGSDILVKVGLGFDSWFEKLINLPKQALVIDASHNVAVIFDEVEDNNDEHEEVHDDENNETEEHHHHHELGNPHYWGDPENAKVMAMNILDGLIQAKPGEKEYFSRNYQSFIAELDQVTMELMQQVDDLAQRKIVSYSAAFPYFYTAFGFENLATVEATCEQEVSPKRIMEIIKLIKDENIKVIVGEAVYPTLPENLAKETGAKVILLWPSSLENGDYIETVKVNVEKMVSALQ
jgi:zinc transport system substrate-binding protein